MRTGTPHLPRSKFFATATIRSGSTPNFFCRSLSDARRDLRRQDAVTILLRLVVEELRRWHRHNAQATAHGAQLPRLSTPRLSALPDAII